MGPKGKNGGYKVDLINEGQGKSEVGQQRCYASEKKWAV